jgi:hypothetical protein
MFEVTVYRGSLAELNKQLNDMIAGGWAIVSVSLHSTLIYPDKPYDVHPQSDWVICARQQS